MEIKITTQQLLNVLLVLAWIIFVGLCVDAGGVLFNAFSVLFFNRNGAHFFWKEIDLSGLIAYDMGYFMVITVLMSIVAILQSILFYLIVKILHDKKLNFTQPFNAELVRFISGSAYLSMGIALFSSWGVKNVKWLVMKGVTMPDIHGLGFDGAGVWLFMGIILLVIAQIFKRGVEIQAENDLTI